MICVTNMAPKKNNMKAVNGVNIKMIKKATIDNKSSGPGHWSKGLVASMENPDLVIKQDPLVTVINDKYPKAKHHFLVLPNEDISGIFKLDKTHLSLLRHMELVGKRVVDDIKNCTFKIGYHSIPSMQRLHLHVISDDMVSDCLKTKLHWNTFTTDFFIPSQDLISMIEKTGKVIKISEEDHKAFLATPLQCHKCKLPAKNMPALKAHILTHL